MSSLLQPVLEDDLVALETALKQGADPNAPDPYDGKTPLHFARSAGAVRLLLDHGAEVNAACPYGSTPLHAAAEAGRPDVVQALLEAGADVALSSSEGRNALAFAMRAPVVLSGGRRRLNEDEARRCTLVVQLLIEAKVPRLEGGVRQAISIAEPVDLPGELLRLVAGDDTTALRYDAFTSSHASVQLGELEYALPPVPPPPDLLGMEQPSGTDEERARLYGALVHRGLAEIARSVMPHASAALTLAPGNGRSRIGGPAQLPRGEPVPTLRGEPVPLLLQLDLEEVARLLPDSPLPKEGVLAVYAFADERRTPEGREGFVVKHWLGELEWRPALPTEHPQTRLELKRVLSIPGARTAEGELLFGSKFRAQARREKLEELDHDEELTDEFEGDIEALEEGLRQSYAEAVAADPEHSLDHLLGHAHPFQDDVIVEALVRDRGLQYPLPTGAYADLQRTAAVDWRCLLQLTQLMPDSWTLFGDGSFYLVISRDDLAARRFDRVLAVAQR